MTRKTLALVAALGLIQASCAGTATSPTTASTASVQGSKRADDLVVVDCLLPGQLRQLGTGVTFVTARRPVKSTAGECAIRGGEYVSYDRADLKTALRFWMPLAEGGDVEAMNNVGEIYDRGMGVPPDYKLAAEWYRKAADKGNARAAMSLGNLYEQGLGVPKDRAQAVAWYQRASGRKDIGFGGPAPDEVARLQRELDGARKELQSKQAELDRTKKELEDARKTRDQRQGEIDAERARIAELRKTLQESQQRQQSGTGRVQALERDVNDAQARLATKERELADARAAAASRTEAALQREKAAADDAQAQRKKLDELRQSLAQVQGDAQTSRARVTDLEKSIAEREGRLKAKDGEVADLRAKIAKLEETERSRAQVVVETRQKASGAPPEIQLIEPEIIVTRDTSTPSVQAAKGELMVVGKVVSTRGLMSLMVDGREQQVDSASMFKSKLAVTTPGQTVRVVAIDKDGRKSTMEFMIRERSGGKPGAVPLAKGSGVGHPLPTTKVAFGNYHALVIGNNEYQKMPKLKTAAEDAREVARILEKDYGFRVKLLVNATRYDILAALNDLRGKLTPEDNFLVYYAGHGELDEKNQRGHWLPVDAEPNSSANWISNVQITDVLNAMSVKQLLVVADSCYAGTLTRAANSQLAGGVTEEDRWRAMQSMARSKSRMVMTSGGVEPVLDSSGDGKHSIFAQTFVGLLKKNEGVLPGQALFNQLQLDIAAIAGRVEMQQVPQYAPIKYAGHESGDFFFVRRTN
jgi:caspase domain-containing protein/Sel1 repeat-containing protein